MTDTRDRKSRSLFGLVGDMLNVPKQLGIAASKVKQGIDEKPVPYLAGLAAGVAVVGSIVVAVLRRR